MFQDTIIRIKNAQAVGKSRVKVPFSKLNEGILEVLSKYHYVKNFSKKGRGIKKIIDIEMSYHEDGTPKISTVKFLSKPSRRSYVKSEDLRIVRQGFGLGLISTSKGIMEVKDARRSKLGGEYLFQIW